MFDRLRLDLRYAFRQLRRTPVFTIVASASLAVGTAVAVAAVSVSNALFFKPLPIANPHGVYRVYTSDGGGRDKPYGASSYPDYVDFAASPVFSMLVAEKNLSFVVTGEPLAVASRRITAVSPNYFSALGIRLQRGPGLPADPYQPAIIVSHRTWQRDLAADPNVLGSRVNVNGVSLEIAGVAPPEFRGLSLDIEPVFGWISAPLLAVLEKEPHALNSRGYRGWQLLARLPDGSTPATAMAQLEGIADHLATRYPGQWIDDRKETRRVSLLTPREANANPGVSGGGVLIVVGGILGLVGLVLLLACTNVAGLLLARALSRRHEIAVRLTLGASRTRLITQLLSESALLAFLGGALGCLITVWAVDALRASAMLDSLDLRPDFRVLAGTIAVCLISAVAFGLAPALQSLRADLRSSLSSAHTMGSGPTRLRGAVMAAQVAVSFVLLLLSIVAARGITLQTSSDPGFSSHGLLIANLNYSTFGDDEARASEYARSTIDALTAIPGVQNIATVQIRPLDPGSRSNYTLKLPGGEEVYIDANSIGGAYFETMGLPLLRGRAVATSSSADLLNGVANETFAKRAGRELIGEVVDAGEGGRILITGVVRDVKYHTVDEAPRPYLYVARPNARPRHVMMRIAAGREREVTEAARRALQDRFPDQVPPTIESMQQYMRTMTLPQRIISRVALSTGAIELALAAVGLYGLLLYSLFARTREIGLRLALGADAREAGWAVMREGLRFAFFGLLAGLVVGVPVVMVASNGLVGARASDPVAFALATVTILVAVMAAAWAPVRRAVRIQPASALRYD